MSSSLNTGTPFDVVVAAVGAEQYERMSRLAVLALGLSPSFTRFGDDDDDDDDDDGDDGDLGWARYRAANVVDSSRLQTAGDAASHTSMLAVR